MRQLIVDSMPDADGCVRLSGKDLRYLARVLRLAFGDAVEVRLPSGELVLMRCLQGENTRMILRLDRLCEGKSAASTETGVTAAVLDDAHKNCAELWLFQCMPKPRKMDDIVRQAAELGAARIVPVLSRYAFAGDGSESSRMERWSRIVKEARQQSGSPVQTAVSKPLAVTDALALWNSRKAECEQKSAAFILTESPLETKSLYGYLTSRPVLASVVIGPEGGVSGEEQDVFGAAGFLPLHIKTNVLRSQTAAIYALAALQYAIMEFDSWHPKE